MLQSIIEDFDVGEYCALDFKNDTLVKNGLEKGKDESKDYYHTC